MPENPKPPGSFGSLVDAALEGEKRYATIAPRFPKADVRAYIAAVVLVGTALMLGTEFAVSAHVAAGKPLDIHEALSSYDSVNAFAFTSVGAVIGYYFGRED